MDRGPADRWRGGGVRKRDPGGRLIASRNLDTGDDAKPLCSYDGLTLADIDALDGDRVACPACGPSRTGAHKRNKKVLRIWRVEPGFATYCCARCGIKGYAHDGANGVRRRRPSDAVAVRACREQRKQVEAADELRRIEVARRIMDEPQLDGEIIGQYLASRSINLAVPAAIRFSPAVWHPYERRQLPAMVSRIEHPITGAFMGVHVTFLKPDGSGKAAVKPDRIMRGIAGGGVVRLAEPGAALALAEGIESALSFMQLSGLPAWAALSAGNLCKVKLPASVQEVVIAADHDERGLADARKAGQCWRREGYPARIVHPTFPGHDWNNILKGGANG